MGLTDAQRRERWCDVRTRRAEDLTSQDVIRWKNRWTEVMGVYRDMDEWEHEFGAIGGDTAGPERKLTIDALDWASPAWVLLRLFDLDSSNPAETADTVARVYRFELIEVQTLPAWEPQAEIQRLDPDLIRAARAWVADCSWAELNSDEDVADLSDAEIIRGIQRHYAGGLAQFTRDSGHEPAG